MCELYIVYNNHSDQSLNKRLCAGILGKFTEFALILSTWKCRDMLTLAVSYMYALIKQLIEQKIWKVTEECFGVMCTIRTLPLASSETVLFKGSVSPNWIIT